jgi:DNA-binding HxlR family transcriptional regulator
MNESQEELNADLKELFAGFADYCSQFSKSVLKHTGYDSLQTLRFMEPNLRISKTVFSKWSIEILVVLYTYKSARFSEIQRVLPQLSSRILSLKLKSLERIGLIKRVVSRTRPPSTRYQLTDEGLIIVKMGDPVFLYLGLTKHFYHNILSTHPTEA